MGGRDGRKNETKPRYLPLPPASWGELKIRGRLVSFCMPAARVSAANALLDRGYGKPPQHITGEDGPRYVALMPEVAKSVEEWEASVQAMLASDQAPLKPNAQIEGPRCDAPLLLGVEKSEA